MNLTMQKGFTLAEVLIAAMVVAIALCGLIATYVGCFNTIAVSKNTNIAMNYAQGLMEQIRNTPFPQIPNFAYAAAVPIFTQLGILSSTIVYVDNTNPELLRVTISVCWKQKNRVFGEDNNLNGVLNAGEDTNGNGIIDSPAEIVALIANR